MGVVMLIAFVWFGSAYLNTEGGNDWGTALKEQGITLVVAAAVCAFIWVAGSLLTSP